MSLCRDFITLVVVLYNDPFSFTFPIQGHRRFLESLSQLPWGERHGTPCGKANTEGQTDSHSHLLAILNSQFTSPH